jgi:hypothetical protein
MFGDFKIRRKVILTVKHSDGLVLLAKKETALQGTADRLIGIARCYRWKWIPSTDYG